MIGVDTPFLVQLELVVWRAGVRQVLTANPVDFQLFGFQLLTAWLKAEAAQGLRLLPAAVEANQVRVEAERVVR